MSPKKKTVEARRTNAILCDVYFADYLISPPAPSIGGWHQKK